MRAPGGDMHDKEPNSLSLDYAEVALELIVRSATADGSCGGPWGHELTPVVKNCAVESSGSKPVLQVNPVWLRELLARSELKMLADEMHTWFAIQDEVARLTERPRARCIAA